MAVVAGDRQPAARRDRTVKLPGWVGSLGIVVWVWYWDNTHETISRWHWKHPWLTLFVFTWIWSHLVLKRPRKVLVWW